MCPSLKSHPLVQIPKNIPLNMSDCWRPGEPVVVMTYALASLGPGPARELPLGVIPLTFVLHMQWWSGSPCVLFSLI